ncbi:MAG: hypothetical protein KAS32_00575 [Candidatus Peribacteraceae bacterium]|nr:hypothetical protein [Candidatus Peribacteraceae bacterium]
MTTTSTGTAGGFVCAALPSFRQHIAIVLKKQPEMLPEYGINSFLLEHCNKFLSSVGTSLSPKKIGVDKNLFKRYTSLFNKFKATSYLRDCELILDSAGFQFQTGQIPKVQVPMFLDMYHDFLQERVDDYTNAFVLDPVPGPVDAIIESYTEMENLNIMSYNKSMSMPQAVKDKIMYIHHFRTPMINKLYKKMTHEYGFADHFQNFATGGMVAFSRGAQGSPPIVLYTIPLIAILKHAIKVGLKKFRFHVLGATEMKDVIAHKLFEHHIKKVHDIDVEITYDSSTIFRTLMMGRYLFVPVEDQREFWKMNVRSDSMHLIWKDNGTVEQHLYNMTNTLCHENGLAPVNIIDNPFYKDGRITQLMYVHGMLLILKAYDLCGKWSDDFIRDAYPLYENGQISEFNTKLEDILYRFNNGKKSRNVRIRTNAMSKSLDIITNLDEDFCDFVVDKYLGVDEPPELKKCSIGECTF